MTHLPQESCAMGNTHLYAKKSVCVCVFVSESFSLISSLFYCPHATLVLSHKLFERVIKREGILQTRAAHYID
jgi:hypothetical protein